MDTGYIKSLKAASQTSASIIRDRDRAAGHRPLHTKVSLRAQLSDKDCGLVGTNICLIL